MPWGVGIVFLFLFAIVPVCMFRDRGLGLGWVRYRDVRSQVRKVCGWRDWEVVVMVMVRVLRGIGLWVGDRVFTVHDTRGLFLFGEEVEETGEGGRLNVQMWFREVI